MYQIKEQFMDRVNGVWETRRTEEQTVEQSYIDNINGSIKFFRSLGGTETKRYSNGKTILTSTSPDGNSRTIRTWKRV